MLHILYHNSHISKNIRVFSYKPSLYFQKYHEHRSKQNVTASVLEFSSVVSGIWLPHMWNLPFPNSFTNYVTIFNPPVRPGICILRPEAAKVSCDRRSQDSMRHRGPIFAAWGRHGCLWAEPTRYSKSHFPPKTGVMVRLFTNLSYLSRTNYIGLSVELSSLATVRQSENLEAHCFQWSTK